ncbi:MAG TPA: LCP family protein, partial [Anaerolineales bacterium]|nr:LCP family protein [Anaerolineales bacterium]
MKLSSRGTIILLSLTLTACGSTPAPQAAPFVLITPAADASPTPTPFQPPLIVQASPTSLYYIEVPTLEPFFPTTTPSPTPTEPPQPTATVDLSSLFPTAAAPPLPDTSGEGPTPLPPLTDNDTVNFLLIGRDQGSVTSFRTDTMIIVILWPEDGQVSMISIPRDLWIYIPTVGMQRINTAYEFGNTGYTGGGVALLRDTIAYNLGIRIDHTAMVAFDGFQKIVDTLGGVDVPVACPYTDWHLIDPSYNPYDENNWSLYTVESGVNHMDGNLALWYARSRLKSSDFDRARRQQEVLRALFTQLLKTDTLSRIPQLYNDLSGTINTDLGLSDLLKLALYAPKLTSANIRSYYIRPPYVTSWTTPAGAAVLLPQAPDLTQMLTKATSLSATAVQRQTISVEVQNGTTTANWDTLAANRLNYAGFTTTITSADRQDYNNSVLIDLTSTQDPTAR